jgi:cobalt-zinc-cadmium efflux system outer membrane protein
MRMKQTETTPYLGICVLLLLVNACTMVSPRPDYERTAQLITQAIGQEPVYRPEDEAVVKNTVDELLAGGVTAQEAVQLCLLNNPKLQATFLNAGIARAEVVQAGLFSNPMIGFSPRFPDRGGPTSFEASLAQNIAELWQIPARKRAAEHNLEQTLLALAREVSTTALAAKAAYYKAVRADRAIEVIQGNVDITKQLVDLAKVREEAGVGSLVDVQLSESELLQMELALRAAMVARFEARTELTQFLGLLVPPDQLQLTDSLPDPPQWTVAPEQLIALARSHRLDLQAAQNAVRAAEARVDEEKRKAIRGVEVGGIRDAEDRTGPTLGVELPLFDQNQAQIARATYLSQQASKQLEALIQELTQDTRVTYERARHAWETTRFYQQQLLPLREDSLELSREAYRYGRASFLQVLEAERKLLEARAGYLEALQNSSTALVDLERVTGQPAAQILSATQQQTTPFPATPANRTP